MIRTDVDQTKLMEFMHQTLGDIASGASMILVILGERLGLYKALAEAKEPLTSEELATKTGTVERLVREWLANQVVSGYVTYHSNLERYSLSPEQKLALADEDSPVYVLGAFKFIKSYFHDEEEFIKVFRNERTFCWEDHNPLMAEGVGTCHNIGQEGHGYR